MKKTKAGNIAADQLRGIVERIEKLTEERDAIAADIRDVLAESKGNGFSTKAIREILKLRKLDAHERDENEHILDTYKRCLGMAPELDEDNND